MMLHPRPGCNYQTELVRFQREGQRRRVKEIYSGSPPEKTQYCDQRGLPGKHSGRNCGGQCQSQTSFVVLPKEPSLGPQSNLGDCMSEVKLLAMK